MTIEKMLHRVVSGDDLSREQMAAAMQQIMTGRASAAQIGGFLVALKMKRETVDELIGAAEVMRALSTPVNIETETVVDTCGTGGDGANLFNVSTAAAFVVAACGGKVAKHGNRSVSSTTGSADLLEAAGICLAITPDQVAKCITDVGIGFMFAPAHHRAMKYAIGPRRELAMRTLFNLLGPLTNPAAVRRQVIGVFDGRLCRTVADVLKQLGSEHVLVVHAQDGLDEFTLAGTTAVAELHRGEIAEYSVKPEDVGLVTQSLQGLTVSSAEESLAIIRDALSGSKNPVATKAADFIAFNAGAAVYVSGIANSLQEGVDMAADAIGGGLAKAKMQELAAFTQCCDRLNSQ